MWEAEFNHISNTPQQKKALLLNLLSTMRVLELSESIIYVSSSLSLKSKMWMFSTMWLRFWLMGIGTVPRATAQLSIIWACDLPCLSQMDLKPSVSRCLFDRLPRRLVGQYAIGTIYWAFMKRQSSDWVSVGLSSISLQTGFTCA